MKSKLTEEIRELAGQSLTWAKLEVEYIKLTAAEKMVMMLSAMVIGAVMAVFLLPVLIMFLFALADVFKLIMAPALAYLTVAGIVLAVLGVIFLLRRQLIINPIARYLTRLLLERNGADKQ